MNYGLHLLKTPTDKITFCGSVPIVLMNATEPTKADVMAGRTIDGKAYKPKVFNTAKEAREEAARQKVELCKNPNCACFKLQ